jgi:hypothetical protein
MKWKLHQMDMNIAFLNGVIEEEVYIENKVEDKRSHVCILKKALYGLKQSPRAWYGHIESFLMSLGFTKSKEDSNLYFKICWRSEVTPGLLAGAEPEAHQD